jgi:hypothetical protein
VGDWPSEARTLLGAYSVHKVATGGADMFMPCLPVPLHILTRTLLSFPLLKVSISTYIPLQRASTTLCTIHCCVRLEYLDIRLQNTFNLGVINGVGCLIISERFPNRST